MIPGAAASKPDYVRQSMEGIVRQLAQLPKQPVIILLYTAKSDFAAVDKSIAPVGGGLL